MQPCIGYKRPRRKHACPTNPAKFVSGGTPVSLSCRGRILLPTTSPGPGHRRHIQIAQALRRSSRPTPLCPQRLSPPHELISPSAPVAYRASRRPLDACWAKAVHKRARTISNRVDYFLVGDHGPERSVSGGEAFRGDQDVRATCQCSPQPARAAHSVMTCRQSIANRDVG
jgi:hypothetical protein